jgi:maltose O-acetyltransferase
MSAYIYKVLIFIICSEFVPASLRTKLLRLYGFPISREVCIWPGASIRSKKIQIGTGVFINVGFYYDGCDILQIGDNIRIGPYVRIITAAHKIGPSSQRGSIEVVGRPVRIGNGCWIGANVTILPGVTIAKGCVIGANSLVTRDTDPDGLYLGSPARRVRDFEADLYVSDHAGAQADEKDRFFQTNGHEEVITFRQRA